MKAQTSESVGQLLERKGLESAINGNQWGNAGWSMLGAAYSVLTPGGDRLSEVNARAQNDEIVPAKDLAVAGAHSLGELALTAAPQVLSSKPLGKAVADVAAKGGKGATPFRMFSGKLRIEKHLHSVHPSIQKALGVKVANTTLKPWHVSFFGKDIMLNPYNPLWKLFPGAL